jgi:hypothetical protein
MLTCKHPRLAMTHRLPKAQQAAEHCVGYLRLSRTLKTAMMARLGPLQANSGAIKVFCFAYAALNLSMASAVGAGRGEPARSDGGRA